MEVGEVMPFSYPVELVDFTCDGELGVILHPTNICSLSGLAWWHYNI